MIVHLAKWPGHITAPNGRRDPVMWLFASLPTTKDENINAMVWASHDWMVDSEEATWDSLLEVAEKDVERQGFTVLWGAQW